MKCFHALMAYLTTHGKCETGARLFSDQRTQTFKVLYTNFGIAGSDFGFQPILLGLQSSLLHISTDFAWIPAESAWLSTESAALDVAKMFGDRGLAP